MAFNENLLLQKLHSGGFNGNSGVFLILWFHNTLAKRQWRRGDCGSSQEAGTSACERLRSMKTKSLISDH